MQTSYDLVVIGCGPAGEKGAVQAAWYGKSVLVIDRAAEPGGAAVHTGTLPSKTLRETALHVSGLRTQALYGGGVQPVDPQQTAQLLATRRQAIAQAESLRMRHNLERHGCTLVQGHARVTGPHEVLVNLMGGEAVTVRGEVILVATGTRPHRPGRIPFDGERVFDSDTILSLNRVPARMVVIGGGVIGCEYACMFAALGVAVTILDGRDPIIPYLDREILGALRGAMESLGIVFRLGMGWEDVERTEAGVCCRLSSGEVLSSDVLLFAAGRTGNTEYLGLEAVDLQPDARGLLAVDASYRTAVPSIVAAGDVIGFPALASTAMEQGRMAVCHAFGFHYRHGVSALLPYGIYTIPEVSTVGLTEEGCQAQQKPYVVGRCWYRDLPRGQITGDTQGVTKLIVCPQTRHLLGVHVIGGRASELVHIGLAIMQVGGRVDDLIDMVFNYPTLSESYKYAAYDALGALARLGAGASAADL